MYNNSRNILTGLLCFVVVAVIVVGALFACGVFKKGTTTGTKLPIVYPDKNINWVQVNDTTLRASFDDKLDINSKQEFINMTIYVNDFTDKLGVNLSQSKSDDDVNYETWNLSGDGYVQTGYYDEATKTDLMYRIRVVLYNNATLTDAGDVTSGKGFVLEFGDLQSITDNEETGDKTYTPVDIEKIKVVSIYQSGDNDKLLN